MYDIAWDGVVVYISLALVLRISQLEDTKALQRSAYCTKATAEAYSLLACFYQKSNSKLHYYLMHACCPYNSLPSLSLTIHQYTSPFPPTAFC